MVRKLFHIAILYVLISCSKTEHAILPTIKFIETTTYNDGYSTNYYFSNAIRPNTTPDSIKTKIAINAPENLKQISVFHSDSIHILETNGFIESINELYKTSTFQSKTIDTIKITLYPKSVTSSTITVQVFDEQNHQENETLVITHITP